MKRYLLATVSSLALTGVASAADLPMRADFPVKVVAPMLPTWQGFYIGISGGFLQNNTTITDVDGWVGIGGAFGGGDDSGGRGFSTSKTGGLFGGTAGYNYQMGTMVVGIEGDYSGVWNANAQVTHNLGLGGGGPGTSTLGVSLSNSATWLATIRGRAGLAVDANFVYITAGVAWAGINNGFGAGYSRFCSCDFINNGTQAGWVVGGGFEHMFTSNWTVKAEALYVDLGNQTVFPTPAAVAARGAGNYSSFQTQFHNTQVIGRVGLNFKF